MTSGWALAQPSRTVLLDVSLQSKGPHRNFTYNTSPLIPIGEVSQMPVRSQTSDTEKLEIRILATTPRNAPTKDTLDIQVELVSTDGAPEVLGQVKVLAHLNESVAASDSRQANSTVLFTLTPLEIQNP